MKDLTKDSITVHILTMAAPIALSMVVHVAYQLITIGYVSRISTAAVAGVNAAGNVALAVAAFAQILSVGTSSLISHAAGKKDIGLANELMNQSFGLSIGFAVITAVLLVSVGPIAMREVFPDPAVADAASQYIRCVSVGYALLFPMTLLSASLRGTGIVRIPSAIFSSTVLLEIAFLTVLVPGRGIIPKLGVDGAGIATSLSVMIGFAAMWAYLHLSNTRLAVKRELLTPNVQTYRRIAGIGLPAGAELALMFLSTGVIYLAIRNEGASVQAGFGIGFGVLQLILLLASRSRLRPARSLARTTVPVM